MRSLSKDSSATPFSFLKMLWPSFAVSTYEIGVMFVKTARYSVVRSSGTLGGSKNMCAYVALPRCPPSLYTHNGE